ncbi:MAG: hypothetical protein Q9214_001909 [Letrouitia sp. 1 TL-2023]
MPGAGKKRAKAGHKKPEIEHTQSHASAYPPPAVYDGPGSHPGSAAGGSRGRAPSNAPPSVGGGQFGEKSVRSSSRAPSATRGPLRDPARDPDKEQPPINRRVEWGGNAFNYFSTDAMPKVLMRRPGFGKAGNQVQMSINSHNITKPPMQTVYQYDVTVGNGAEKRGLILAVWKSKKVQEALPDATGWIFDGNKLAWALQPIKQEEIRLRVDLDMERGTTPRPNARPNVHAVTIKPAAKQKTIHLSNVRAYLEGKAQFGPEVFEAISKSYECGKNE